MTEVEAVFARHSVRTYQDRPIEPGTVHLLQEKIEALNAAGDLHLQFIPDAGKAFTRLLNRAMGLGSAPSLIACVGPDDETLGQRIGYYGEQLVLYAQTLGLNTCWAATFQEKGVQAEVSPAERLPIVIAIGYGANPGRTRKSKTADEVTVLEGERPAWFARGAELALLPPTAINQQKFRFTLKPDGTVIPEDLHGIHSDIDLGIVRHHFELGARDAGHEITLAP